MNTSTISICRALGLSVLAAGLSSCSLFKNGKYASQWEIESDVPSSLSSGQANVPGTGPMTAGHVKSDLSGADGLAPGDTLPLDLPMTEDGSMIEVPKPALAMMGNPYGQSPPEMLSNPASDPGTDLPNGVAGTNPMTSLTTLLPGPPPVTEEELAAPTTVVTTDPPAGLVAEASPVNPPLAAAVAPAVGEDALVKGPLKVSGAPTIPLLYGQLDLTPFLSPAMLAPEVLPPPAGE